MYDFINPMICQKHESLIAHQSVFGWIISGSFSGVSNPEASTQLCCFSLGNDDISNFWALDTIGIKDNEKSDPMKDSTFVQKFNKTLKFENNKYTVKLLWKSPELPLVILIL